MIHHRGALLATGLAVLMATGSATGQENQSTYTDLDLDACLVMHADDFGASWACPGYRGYPVRIAESDQRFFVSYGFGAEAQPAAQHTLPPFNTLGPKIEWRLENVGGDWRPFATILRFHMDAYEDEELIYSGRGGDVLVVTQLGDEPGTQCHVAWVDASANANANALAREAADSMAGDFPCGDRMPQVIGEFSAFNLE